MVQQQLPKEWLTADQLEGYDFADKAELVGEAFRISTIEFYTNANGVPFVNVQAEFTSRVPFAFNDSSTGVRAQLLDYFAKTHGGEPIEGTVYPVSLVCPRGLRVSTFGITKDGATVPADDKRAERKARTYYLTTSGVAKAAESPVAPSSAEAETTSAPARAKRK